MTNPAGRRWLEHRRATGVIVALTFLFALPSLAVGFFADDYVLRAMLRGALPNNPAWYDLYFFVPGGADARRAQMQIGEFPWWTAPGLKMHLLRPLGSALLAFDERVFGDASAGWHLHSIAWYLLLVVAVAALYRRLLPRATGTVAVLLFAMCESHVQPYGWPSDRHATVACLAGVLALHAYLRDCDDGWTRGRWLAALALAVGLAAGETALELVPYGLAFALFGPAKGEGDRRARLLAALPAIGVLAVYVAVYKLGGYGVAHSGEYFDPATNPVAFARAAVLRLPLFAGDAIAMVPADLGVMVRSGPLAVFGVVAAAGFALLYRACRPAIPEEERAALRWLVPGAVVSLLPAAGGFPGARLLLVADVGFAVLLAALLPRVFVRIAGQSKATLWSRRAWGGLLAVFHFGFAPLLMLVGAANTAKMARASEAASFGADLEGASSARAFVLAASDPMISIYTPGLILATGREHPKCWVTLSAAKASHLVTRTGPSTFTLEPVGTTFLRGAFEKMYRPDAEPLAEGDVVDICGATVRVAALRDGKPSRIDVDLREPLESPALRILEWREGRLRRWAPPAIGARAELPWSPGPMGVF